MKFKYPFLMATLLMLALVGLFYSANIITLSQAIVAFASFQFILILVSPQRAAVFTTALSPEQIKEFTQILDELKEARGLFGGVKELSQAEGGFAAIKNLPDALRTVEDSVAALKSEMDVFRRAQVAEKSRIHRVARPGHVSHECALFIGALAVQAAYRQGKMDMIEKGLRDRLCGRAGEILGIEAKTALSSSDIPLPTEYSGEVVELVSQYGSARRWGTVYPLGTGSVKLPRLKTDTTFGLLAISVAVSEKSPQTEWVTFTAEKFGGMIRVPSEIEEDSIVSIGQFIARYAARNIARVEDEVFFNNLDGSTLGAVKGLCGSTIDNSKVLQMASTKTHYSDATLANLRALRAVPSEGAIAMGAYYFHTTFEQHLSGLNTAGDKPYIANGVNGASLDGFPIRWVPVMPAYSTSANASKVFGLFGDLSFQYLGIRGGIRYDTSREAAFATDEILIRAIERFTIGLMATGAVAGIETAAS